MRFALPVTNVNMQHKFIYVSRSVRCTGFEHLMRQNNQSMKLVLVKHEALLFEYNI